jgi:hypothetical protein
MTIVQLAAFDLATSQPWQIMATTNLWSALPRLSRGSPSARLLMIADTLHIEDIQAGFHQVAVPEDELPPGLQGYRMQYDEFLRQAVDEVRHIRLYLVADTTLEDASLCNLLEAYGVRAQPLDHELPLPFEHGHDDWNAVVTPNQGCWALLRSKPTQFGMIYPRSLHRLFALDFPIWAALQVHTFTEREAVKTLRLKAVTARYMPRKTSEAAQEADEMESTVGRLRAEMNRVGGLLHTVRLYVTVGGEDTSSLRTRLEVVRGALPFDMEPVNPSGNAIRCVFSIAPLNDEDGSPLTSPGVALLTGSALSYRRRTETRGVFLGIDRNQAPVIFNIFDPANPSYNTVVLGQTGSGKTFATLLLMLRHLLLGARLIIIDPQGNVDLGFLGSGMHHKAVLGTRGAAINLLDITHDEIGQQVESVCSMLALLGVLHRSDSLARALLDEALLDIYQPIWEHPDIHVPTLEAVQRRLSLIADSTRLAATRETAQLLAYTLTPYTSGSYAALFNRQTSVDFSLHHPVTIYDVSRLPGQELGGNLRSALLAILVADVNQTIRNLRRAGDTAPILFFVDEMGVLMQDSVIADYIAREFKTARARNVGMIVADQDLHSFLGPVNEKGVHNGAPILANAAFTLLFYQKDSERERLRESFSGLPPAYFESLFSLPRGVCLAQLPDDLLLVHVRPSAFEQLVLSSRLADRQRAKAVVNRMIEELA